MKRAYYRIGHIYLEIQMPKDMMRPQNLSLFEVKDIEAEKESYIVYYLEFTEEIDKVEADLRKRQNREQQEVIRENLHVFWTDCGECRTINFYGADKPYAVTCQESEEKIRVWFDREIAPMLVYDTIFIAPLSLEQKMIKKNSVILHSAYMCYKDAAVLFSAPSGTGKSTQADLWGKYRGTRTINGDRSLLIREEDGWYAYGWPVCGSSEICHNEKYPIRAIVMLKQAKENKICSLKGIKAVRELMAELTINTWDVVYQNAVMDQLEQILLEIPVYKLECDISEEAVKCLEEKLG